MQYRDILAKKTVFHIIGRAVFIIRDGSQICQTSGKVTSHKCTVPCTVIFPIYILSSSNETFFLHFFLYLIETKHAFSVLYLETIFECMILLLWSYLVKVNSTQKWFEIQRSLMRFFFPIANINLLWWWVVVFFIGFFISQTVEPVVKVFSCGFLAWKAEGKWKHIWFPGLSSRKSEKNIWKNRASKRSSCRILKHSPSRLTTTERDDFSLNYLTRIVTALSRRVQQWLKLGIP